MPTPVLPDAEALIIAALREYLSPDWRVAVRILLPENWSNELPVVTVRRVTGAAIDERYLDSGIFMVTVFDHDRAKASLISRTIRRVLFDACIDQFGDDHGYLSVMRDITGPYETRDEFSSDFPDLFRFTGSYQVNTRPRT